MLFKTLYCEEYIMVCKILIKTKNEDIKLHIYIEKDWKEVYANNDNG